jgi:hypothetical protein
MQKAYHLNVVSSNTDYFFHGNIPTKEKPKAATRGFVSVLPLNMG